MLSFQDPLASLSADMIARTYNIFSIILKYAVDMLTWDRENELPLGLEPPYVYTHTHNYIYVYKHTDHTPKAGAINICNFFFFLNR